MELTNNFLLVTYTHHNFKYNKNNFTKKFFQKKHVYFGNISKSNGPKVHIRLEISVQFWVSLNQYLKMFGNLASALRKKNYLLQKTRENFQKKKKKFSKKMESKKRYKILAEEFLKSFRKKIFLRRLRTLRRDFKALL